MAAEAAAQQDGLKDASLLLSAGAADDAPVISAASSTLPSLPTNASGRRFGESARRRKHISLYVDDFVGEEGALQPVPSLLDGELDPGRRAAYWLDEQLRLVISTLRAVGTPLRDANSLGLVSCSWSLLQERCTGVVVSGIATGHAARLANFLHPPKAPRGHAIDCAGAWHCRIFAQPHAG